MKPNDNPCRNVGLSFSVKNAKLMLATLLFVCLKGITQRRQEREHCSQKYEYRRSKTQDRNFNVQHNITPSLLRLRAHPRMGFTSSSQKSILSLQYSHTLKLAFFYFFICLRIVRKVFHQVVITLEVPIHAMKLNLLFICHS